MFAQGQGLITTDSCGYYRYAEDMNLDEMHDKLSVKIFPNPANGLINIELKANYGAKYDMKVINFAGKSIYSDVKFTNKFCLDISSYPNGIYFLIINNGTTQFLEKIIRN